MTKAFKMVTKVEKNKKDQTFVVMFGLCRQLTLIQKSVCKNQASKQKCGSSYFFRALISDLNIDGLFCLISVFSFRILTLPVEI